MYGDVRHISILRDEMDLKNDINAEDIVDTQERYLKDSRKSKYLHGEYQGIRNNDVLTEPHFRPVSTTTTSTTTTTTTPKPTTSSTNSQLVGTKKLDDVDLDDIEEVKEETEENNELDNNTYYDVVAENIKVVKSPQLDKNQSKSETATISTTLKIVQQKIQAINNATMKTTTTTQTTPSSVSSASSSQTETSSLKTTEIKGKPVLMEGQLFQDTIQKEPVIGPNMKGV